jgi:hypothetical protein
MFLELVILVSEEDLTQKEGIIGRRKSEKRKQYTSRAEYRMFHFSVML